MSTKVTVFDELMRAAGIKAKKNESDQAFLRRLATKIEKVPDDVWAGLSEPAQVWNNTAVEALEADEDADIELPDGMARADEPVETEDEAEDAATAADADGEEEDEPPARGKKKTTAKPKSTETKSAAPKTIIKDKTSSKTKSDSESRKGSKTEIMIDMLKRKKGATIAEIAEALNWKPHSTRAVMSVQIRKKYGLEVESKVEGERGRVYRIAA